jgi:hypothetical protein
MPALLATLIFLAGVVLVAVAGYAAWRVLRRWRDPNERERKRRSAVHRFGRLGEALITDIRDSVIYYSYEIRGVAYAASQDVSALVERVPADPSGLIGHSTLKYHPKNPANSIVICEEWSGLRRPS